MRLPLALGILAIAAAPAWAGDETDAYMRTIHPELRSLMRSSHVLGEAGMGWVNGDRVYGGSLAGWSYWDPHYLAAAEIGGVWLSPKVFAPDPANPSDHGNSVLPFVSARFGYNVVGPRLASGGLAPLWQLGPQTVVSLGVGGSAGFATTHDGMTGLGVTAGPLLGARYQLSERHNVTAYGFWQVGLNRAADTYESGLHASFGSSVVELGYRGGQLAAYYQATARGTALLTPPNAVPYGAFFLRFSQGY